MSRLRADTYLLIATVIWGLAFVAQKSAMDHIGPFTFVGLRFLLSALVVLPFVLREWRSSLPAMIPHRGLMGVLCAFFFGGVTLQQLGINGTSVTNAGFLTSLYVVLVPIITLLVFKKHPHFIVWISAPLCLLGVWLLGDASLTALRGGDFLVMACAALFAFHIIFVGMAAKAVPYPLTLAIIQYLTCGVLGLGIGIVTEPISIEAIKLAAPVLLYAGALSGGIAYTLQMIAQQHTPASDAAVILSGEALFAALGGAVVLGDRLSALGALGCCIIFFAILLVEFYPLAARKALHFDGYARRFFRRPDRQR